MNNFRAIFTLLVVSTILMVSSCSNQNSSTTNNTDNQSSNQTSTSQPPSTTTTPSSTESTSQQETTSNTPTETATNEPTATDTATPTDPEKAYAPIIGSYAPPFDLVTLDNNKISLDQFKGKPLVLVFWASWCAKCNATAPELNKFFANHPNDVNIVGINLYGSDTLDGVQKYIERHNITYANAPDTTGDIATRYRVTQTSTYFVINAEGIITDIFSYQTLKDDDFETAFEKAKQPSQN